MAPVDFDLNNQDFILLNSPLAFLNVVANIFYACCLIFPRHGNRQRLKQPLTMLLGFLVWCTMLYFSSLIVLNCEQMRKPAFEFSPAVWFLIMYSVYTSMTSYVWLNFYYFTQIVPAQQTALIWVKKRIKCVMCLVLCFDRTFFFLTGMLSISKMSFGSHINNTQTDNVMVKLYMTGFFMLVIYTSLCLCVMLLSSASTVSYLLRHMKSMAASGSAFSSPRLRGQMRVTITGICQGLLYFLYGSFNLLQLFSFLYPMPFKFGVTVTCTVTTMYISGTTVNLGIGQTIFRQRAAAVWKDLKALCVYKRKLDSTQPTSIALAETADVPTTL